MAEKEYIEREKAYKTCEAYFSGVCVYDVSESEVISDFEDVIDAVPSADVSRVRHGRWNEIVMHNGCTPDYDCLCSMCKKSGMPTYYFCPHCGAKMDGDEK